MSSILKINFLQNMSFEDFFQAQILLRSEAYLQLAKFDFISTYNERTNFPLGDSRDINYYLIGV